MGVCLWVCLCVLLYKCVQVSCILHVLFCVYVQLVVLGRVYNARLCCVYNAF